MKFKLLLSALLFSAVSAAACTSMVVSARASASGRPLLWKHRDTGADNNFLQRVAPTDTTFGYVALFNAGDSLLLEAWIGMNDAGFAIMNTASYNLQPDTATFIDQEGVIMSAALARCTSVEDFESLICLWARPRGVQANFGVIDAHGGAAYFEVDDHNYQRFDADDAPDGYLIRTNYSFSGVEGKGYGYIRYATAEKLTAGNLISPQLLTESLSRSFYHSLQDIDYLSSDFQYVYNADFIPRDISTASIVIEGINPSDNSYLPSDIRMFAVLGYPPVAPVNLVTLDHIPTDFLPDSQWRSPACDRAHALYLSLIPFSGGSGPHYLILPELRRLISEAHTQSLILYNNL